MFKSTITPDIREKAKAEKKALITVSIDWRFCEKKKEHLKAFSFAGAFTPEQTTRFYKWASRFLLTNQRKDG